VILYRFGSDALRAADEEFNGQGGLLAPGRWSLVGKPCVYASTCEPLALLEKLVHFAGLLVPSVLISGADPTIKNCLLNPEHPRYAHAKFFGPIPLAIDPRF